MPRTPIAALAGGTLWTLTTAPQVVGAIVAPQSEVQVTVTQHGNLTPLTVYAAEAGTDVLTPPVLTSIDGVLPGFLDVATLSASGADLQVALSGGTVTVTLVTPGVVGGSSSGSTQITVNGHQGPNITLAAADVGAEPAGTAATQIAALGLGTASTHAASDFDAAGSAAGAQAAAEAYALPATSRGAANGVASLGSDLQVPASQLAHALDSVAHVVLPSADTTGITDIAAINSALNTYKTVILHGYYYINAPISPPSNSTLILADATVFLAAGSNCNLVLNQDYLGTSGGNTNVRIIGHGTALFDQNGSNQTYATANTAPAASWKGHGIVLSHVSNYEISNVQFQDVIYYCITPQQTTDGLIRNIYQATPGPLTNAIIQTMGKTARLTIDGVRGQSEDDAVALSTGDLYSAYYADQTLVGPLAGDVTDVTIRNVDVYHVTSASPQVHLICLFTGSGCKMQRISIDNVHEQFPTTDSAQIGIGVTDYFIAAPSTSQAGPNDLSDITITNTNARLVFSGSCANVKVSGVEIPNATIPASVAPFLFTGGQGGTTYTNIAISDVHFNGPSTTHSMFEFTTASGPLYAAGANSINGLRLTNIHSNGNLPSFINNLGAIITGLVVRNVDAASFTGGIVATGGSGTIAGSMNDINVSAALPTVRWGSVVLNVALGLNCPTWGATDPAPQAIDRAIINSDGSFVLDGGTVRPATFMYRANGQTFNTPALLTHSSAAFTSGSSGATTAAIDTTGATLLVATVSYFSNAAPTLTDSKGNTWTALTTHASATPYKNLIYYCATPIVGVGHTFSLAGTNIFGALAVAAFSGAGTVTNDAQNGASSTSTTAIQTGSVTPAHNNELVIAGLVQNGTVAATIDSGLTIIEQIAAVSSVREGVALAYLIQSAASAVNPTWSGTFNTSEAASIATFSFATGAGGGTWYRMAG